MPLTLVTPPAVEPVTLIEAKAHLRVTATDEDTLITALIKAARQQAEHRTVATVFVTQTWTETLDAFPAEIVLSRRPLQSVSSITYTDTDGTEQTLAVADYQVVTDELLGRIVPAYGVDWPTARDMPGAVVVTYVAGYGAAADVPESIKSAVLLLIGHLYEHREAVSDGSMSELPMAVDALLAPYWVARF